MDSCFLASRGSNPQPGRKIAKKPDDAKDCYDCNFFTAGVSQGVIKWRVKYISEGKNFCEGKKGNYTHFGVGRDTIQGIC
jgi:hypothetical protein